MLLTYRNAMTTDAALKLLLVGLSLARAALRTTARTSAVLGDKHLYPSICNVAYHTNNNTQKPICHTHSVNSLVQG